jgi:hypothetical protein
MSTSTRRYTVDLGQLTTRPSRCVLRFLGVRHTGPSFVVKVFVDAADAPPGDAAADPERRADANVYLYGHGDAVAGAPQFDASRHPPLRELEPFDTVVDITRALARWPELPRALQLTLRVVDPEGRELPAHYFQVDQIRLEGSPAR